MKKFAFLDFVDKPLAFVASTTALVSLVSRSPAFSPLLGSVKPSSKPGAALAAAATASRPVPSPHAIVIRNRKANILSQKILDSVGSTESNSKVGAISKEEEKEGSTVGSNVGISGGLVQYGDN